MESVALRYLRGAGRNGSAHAEKQLNKKRWCRLAATKRPRSRERGFELLLTAEGCQHAGEGARATRF